MTVQSAVDYAREIKPLLSRCAFDPARSRLLWLPVHVTVIALGIVAIGAELVTFPYWWALSVVIGMSFAGLMFLGHETLHGAVVRGLRLRHVIGWFTFAPFAISPRLWIAWHNRVHHGNANHPGADPDTFPTIEEYRNSRRVRFITRWFSLGERRILGVTSLLVGFSVQSGQMLFGARQWKLLAGRQMALARLETAGGIVAWLALLVVIGPLHFLFAFVVPLLMANSIVMAYILTNHALSPHSAVHDPFVTSLSVTVPRWVDWLTLRFGFHVEHHLFPWMSSRHAPEVRKLINARWPDRYHSMPLVRALGAVYRSPRVYADDTTLIEPRTGRRWSLELGDCALRRPGKELVEAVVERKQRVPHEGSDGSKKRYAHQSQIGYRP